MTRITEPEENEPRRRRREPSTRSVSMKLYHASRTEEQRAAWRKKVSVGTSVGMHKWHTERTCAEREHTRRLQADAAVCRIWTPHRPGTKWQKGHRPVANTTPDALAHRAMTRVERASVKRILKDIVGVHPELVRDAIVEGLLAPPPRSFPYIALAAAYLDGKPIDAEPPADGGEDLSNLTRDELLTRAFELARRLRLDAPGVREGSVIDVPSESGK